jgi:hypothetical protein
MFTFLLNWGRGGGAAALMDWPPLHEQRTTLPERV